MRARIAIALFCLGIGSPVHADESTEAVLYRNPNCGCCEGYADYLRANGFEVTVESRDDLSAFKRTQGVPEPLEGCHTTLVEGYVIEGHVPINMVNRLLGERPDIRGISLPGMPQGSPGMSGRKQAPFTTFEISEGDPKVYAVE